MITLDDILKLVASHQEENQEALSKLGERIYEQEKQLFELLAEYVVEQDPTVSRKALLNKIKGSDLAYWYTPLEKLPGYPELNIRTKNCLLSSEVYYLGDLVTLTERELLRTPNFGRKSLHELKTWLADFGEKLEQELTNWPENRFLRTHFNTRIQHRDDGLSGYRMLRHETYEKLATMNIRTVGELATSDVYKTMADADLQAIETYLEQWDPSFHLGMPRPKKP